MPKEVVQYPATDVLSGTEISVHWDKIPSGRQADEGHVNISTERHYWMEMSSQVGVPGEPLQTVTEGKVNERFMSDPLTRGEINKLIRVLRRARDDAFGSDA